MEHTNHPFRKEHDLPNLYGNLPGCTADTAPTEHQSQVEGLPFPFHHLLTGLERFLGTPKTLELSLRFRAPCWTLWHLEEITGEHLGDREGLAGFGMLESSVMRC